MTTIRQCIMLLLLLFVATACQQPSTETADSAATDTTDTTPSTDTRSTRPSPPDSTSATMGTLTVSVHYGSPSVKGRAIWGALVPYGEVWRTGANEATTFDISTEALVAGNLLPAGTYSLFTIPNEEEWTVILNKTANLWGSYEYNQEEDALRFQVTANGTTDFSERMTFTAKPQEENVLVVFHWENLTFSFPVALP